jgi:redox-sensitive bicupin YhaK (pirin superfamily)
MPEIRRSSDRYVTETAAVTTLHSFSYGAHYDPQNVGFGPLIAINEENVAPGAGYDPHRHADVEIVTWVLEGALDHEDTTGHRGTIRPGTAQRLSAGTGVQHAERNASATEPLRFVQMMLASEHLDAPEYGSVDVVAEPGALVPAVSVQAPAELFVLHLDAGQSITVPGAARSLVHVTTGSVHLDGETLEAGDEARLTDGSAYDLSASGPADALIWQVLR